MNSKNKNIRDLYRGINECKRGYQPVLFNSALEHGIRKVQENQVGLKLNETHQLLVYTDYVNLLGDYIDTTKKTTENVTEEIGLEVNTKKTMYKLLSCH
jgi:hypothetical protein